MRDWRQIVRVRLSGMELSEKDTESIVEELSAHLEDHYNSQLANGVAESQAAENALKLVGDWEELSAGIYAAKNEEGAVNYRTRAIWVPGLISLTLSMLWLMFLLRMEWYSRTNSGLIHFTPPLMPYLWWLVAQPLVGALGAHLSRKASGSVRARIVAGLFPAIAMFGVMIVAAWSAFLVEKNSYVLHHPIHFVLGVVPWVVIPAVMLFVGVLPICWWRSAGQQAAA